jgi:hypothetical protein
MAQEKRISRRTAVRAAGAALVAGAALGAGAAPRAAQARQAPLSPVGVWVVSSTRAGQIPNGVLLTIHPDGTLLRIGTNHPTEAPGVGVWEQVGERVYNFSYVSLQFDAAGAFAGRRKASLQFTLDSSGQTLAGTGVVAFFDANDVPGDSTPADIVGTRMAVEPAP